MAGRIANGTGQVAVWLTSGALALDLLLIVGLVGLIGWNGIQFFRQPALVSFELESGERILGELRNRETARQGSTAGRESLRIFVGNRDLLGLDFRWILADEVTQQSTPASALLIERLEWGRFHGYAERIERGAEMLASGPDTLPALRSLMDEKAPVRETIEALEDEELLDINDQLEALRLRARRTAEPVPESEQTRARALQREYERQMERLRTLRKELEAEVLVARTADGQEARIRVSDIVRVVEPNALSPLASGALLLSRVGEFLADEPRESNTEGGIFPAIFGTVLMVFLTSIAVAPFGVLAAVYLREYARAGWAVRTIRIAVNSLAGVPSIVFGMFGLGFFVYLVGGGLDRIFFSERLPAPTFGTGGILWASLTLALLTVPVVIVSTEEGIAAVPRAVREGSLALGATRFETLWRVVLPFSTPGILTGLILAMARAAGEVAPLMIVGMVKLAPSLPLDAEFPYLHLERKFMHLGFHIYDVGFQSPNVEAVQPLVFATALLLIGVVIATNLTAILLRNRLRARFATSTV